MEQRMIDLTLRVPASLITAWIDAQWRREAIGLPWQSIEDYYAGRLVQDAHGVHGEQEKSIESLRQRIMRLNREADKHDDSKRATKPLKMVGKPMTPPAHKTTA